jgi:hypothetical protein
MRLLVAILVAWCAVFPAAAEPIEVTAHRVVLHDGDRSRTAVDGLIFRGGLDLRSPDDRFGGLSALAVSADGGRLIALSDKGFRVEARLVHDGRGNLAGIDGVRLEPLRDTDGDRLKKKKKSDAESLAVTADGLLVAFERRHRIWRYGGDGPPVPLASPPGLAKAPRNGGIEALTALADGRILALTENFTVAGGSVGWVGDGQHWAGLVYVPADGFSATGAATLPDGDVLVLERAYSPLAGPAARLARVDRSAVAADALLVGRPIATLRPPLTVDNFEGVDARLDANGKTLVYLLSDDNFSPLQRTLLLMFELASDK